MFTPNICLYSIVDIQESDYYVAMNVTKYQGLSFYINIREPLPGVLNR